MTLPSDPLEAFRWAVHHSGDAWWVFAAIAAGIAWTSKRMRDWNRRNTPAGAAAAAKAKAKAVARAEAAAARWMSLIQNQGAPPAAAAPAKPAAHAQSAGPASYTAAPSYTAAAYTAAAYTAQAAYAAPPSAAQPAAGSQGRKKHRDGGGPQRVAAPVARSVDVPVSAAAGGGWTLKGAFGDPAHARTAVVIAEVLGPPLGLR